MPELFRDCTQSVTARVDDLLGRMTLTEKVGQLGQRLLGWQSWTRHSHAITSTPLLDAEAARWGGIGAIYGLQRADAWSGQDWSNGATPALAAEVVAAVQDRVRSASRFGIPALIVEEAPHGHQALGAQLWPVNLAMAAGRRLDLIEQAASHTATELAARGVHLALVSGLDLLRDPRWGRSEECYGEDPLLAADFTAAAVTAMTRPGLGVVLKHFAGQGAGIGGRNASGAPLGRRELAEIHLPAARAGVAAGAVGLMAAYNDIDGVPCAANHWLLTELLRGDWGFEGIVMADMFAVDRLAAFGLPLPAAGALALRAGVDLSLCDQAFAALTDAVDEGLLEESAIDVACRRILAVKIRLGLLDPPAAPPSFPAPASALAVDLAASSLVLLRNEDALPLTPGARVAVIGPNSDDVPALLGDYVSPPAADANWVSVVDGLRAVANVIGHERGCDRRAPIDGGLDRARSLAARADVVVLVLGSSSELQYADEFAENGAGGSVSTADTGEGFDVAELILPAAQQELVNAVAATGVQTVAVVVSGRALGIAEVADRCAALLYAWYPGPSGGTAIARVLTGVVEPSGRLPVSLPVSSAALPVAYDERVESTQRYVDLADPVSFPFGAGFGYTHWRLGPVSIDDRPVAAADLDTLTATAELTNVGPRSGSALVELYARAEVAGVLPRRAVLVGYTWVMADSGGMVDARIRVSPIAAQLLGLNKQDIGRVRLWLSITGAVPPAGDIVIPLAAEPIPVRRGCGRPSP